MHLSLLFVFVVHVTRVALALALGGYALRMWAITGGYRRYFARRSYNRAIIAAYKGALDFFRAERGKQGRDGDRRLVVLQAPRIAPQLRHLLAGLA